MSVTGAKEKIHHAMIECEGVSSATHRFGGTEYKLGKREIGHVHGNHLVDIPFPMEIRNEVIEKGEALPHHILPESGWVSVYLKNEENVERAITLLKRSYEIALQQQMKRKQTNHLEKM
jgi:predicted DNA-binding protein (MmcQ/YjbR family)